MELQAILKALTVALGRQQHDFEHRLQLERADKGQLSLMVEPTEDWGIKRLNSIIREAQRLGVEFTSANDEYVYATYKGMELLGYISYETRSYARRNTKWARPRMTLRMWARGDGQHPRRTAEGQPAWGRMGGEALAIVFGKDRMMTYNRLMVALVHATY